MDPLGDGALLQRFARDGSDEAFSSLVNRHAPMVYAVCLRRLGRAEAAEDATQGVFVLLARNAKKLAQRPNVAPWLHRMAVLVCRGVLSKEAKHWRTERALEEVKLAEHSKDETLALVLDDALARLPEKDREAVVLRCLQGLSLAELAEAIGTTPDGARMRVERALVKLRTSLSALGVVVTDSELLHKLALPQAKVPAAAKTAWSAVSSCATQTAKGANHLMKFSILKTSLSIGAVTACAGAFAFLAYHEGLVFRQGDGNRPVTSTPFHAVTFEVQPGGAPRDPKFLPQKTGEQWVDPYRQRITVFRHSNRAVASADYLLDQRGSRNLVNIRDPQGNLLSLTKEQAISGTAAGKWAQEPDITLVDVDFKKLEHFWKHATVEILPKTTMIVGNQRYEVIPHQVTEEGFFRVTGYIDVATGRLVKRETWSKDGKGWYLTDYIEFDYRPFGEEAFSTDSLARTHPFELAMPVSKQGG